MNEDFVFQVCRLMQTTDQPTLHLIMYGTSVVCPRSLAELVCRIRGIRFFGLTRSDVSEERWRKKFRDQFYKTFFCSNTVYG